jgi:hypothetical protein
MVGHLQKLFFEYWIGAVLCVLDHFFGLTATKSENISFHVRAPECQYRREHNRSLSHRCPRVWFYCSLPVMVGTIRPFCDGVQTLFLRGGNDHRPYSLRAISSSASFRRIAHVRMQMVRPAQDRESRRSDRDVRSRPQRAVNPRACPRLPR